MNETKIRVNNNEVTIKKEDIADETTWVELLKMFILCLKGMGYYPETLESFYEDKLEE